MILLNSFPDNHHLPAQDRAENTIVRRHVPPSRAILSSGKPFIAVGKGTDAPEQEGVAYRNRQFGITRAPDTNFGAIARRRHNGI